MQIKRLKFPVLGYSDAYTVYDRETNKVSYYYIELLVEVDGEETVLPRIVYTKKELKKIKKLKYVHIVEEVMENEKN